MDAKSTEEVERVIEESFKTPDIVSVEEQSSLYSEVAYDVRQDRMALMSRLFSVEIDNALEDFTNKLQARIANAQSQEEADALSDDLKGLSRQRVIELMTPKKLFN